jgi:hypothetical protein
MWLDPDMGTPSSLLSDLFQKVLEVAKNDEIQKNLVVANGRLPRFTTLLELQEPAPIVATSPSATLQGSQW